MKFCPSCGRPPYREPAGTCPRCGAVAGGMPDPAGVAVHGIIAALLTDILIVICIIAASLPEVSARPTASLVIAPASMNRVFLAPAEPADNTMTISWMATGDWDGWEHTGGGSGTRTGPCYEEGPRVSDGHGEYGTAVHLESGSSKAEIWQTFTDTTGRGWDTLTFVGRLPPGELPQERWISLDVNDRQLFHAAVAEFVTSPDGIVTLHVHFPATEVVKVRLSHGREQAGEGEFIAEYHSLRLSRESP